MTNPENVVKRHEFVLAWDDVIRWTVAAHQILSQRIARHPNPQQCLEFSTSRCLIDVAYICIVGPILERLAFLDVVQ